MLTQKMKIPRRADLADHDDRPRRRQAGRASGFTAFINPATTITGARRQLRRASRRSSTAAAATSATAPTAPRPPATRPDAGQHADDPRHLARRARSTTATFDTTNPLAWGYDAGGWIYRDLGVNVNYDPATLRSATATIPEPKVAVRYGAGASNGLMYKYGFDVNARGAGQLANRPAMIDQPFGSGRALLLGTNPFYRAWIDGEERLVAQRHPVPARRRRSRRTRRAPAAVAAAAEPAAAAGPGGRSCRRRRSRAGHRWPQHRPATCGSRSSARERQGAARRVKNARLSQDAAGQGPLHATPQSDDDARHAQRAARRPHARKHWVIRDHGHPAPAQQESAPLLRAGSEQGGREGRRTAGPPCSRCRSFSRGWSGQDRAGGRQGSLFGGSVRGADRLGMPIVNRSRASCARSLDRHMSHTRKLHAKVHKRDTSWRVDARM